MGFVILLGRMMTASHHVNEAIDAIYGAAVLPEQWPTALDAIAACFDSVGTALLLNWSGGSISTIVSPSLAAAARDYEEGAWKLDFYVPRALQATIHNPTACFTDRHLGTLDEIGKHDFYTKFRHPHGLGPFLGTQLLPQSNIVAILTVQGRLSRETFSDEEIRLYQIIARHAERALTLTVRLIDAETRAEALADALSRMSCGVFGLDKDGAITFTNAAAERLFTRSLTVENGRLIIEGPGQRQLEAALCASGDSGRQADAQPPVRPIVLTGVSDVERVVLYVLPIGSELPWEIQESFASSRLLVLAIPQPGDRPDPALIRDVLGLTQGEARVAALVGEGKSLKQAATVLGITEESVRTVLKRVFVKTNTSRQSELTAMLARLVLRVEP